MNKSIIGIVVGLMIATSAVYFVETSEELFEEQDMIKGPFFLVVAIAYPLVAFFMLKKNNTIPHVVAIAGTIGIIALYAITRTDMAIAFGMEAGNIGHLGMVSKILQTGIVLGSVLVLVQARKEAWFKPKLGEVSQ
ncbi:MAG: hypothetical protein P8X78_01515 [Nitrosopumilaceae archaeon]|jgi:hypothetical protein